MWNHRFVRTRHPWHDWIPLYGVWHLVFFVMKKLPQRWLHAQADPTTSPTYEVYCKVKGEEVLAHLITTDQTKREVKKKVTDLGYDITKINIADNETNEIPV